MPCALNRGIRIILNMKRHSATLPPESATCWVHWGRTGGGPRFLLELTDGDLENSGETLLSYNPDAEIAHQLSTLPVEHFPVPTYNSKLGVVLGLPRLIINSIRFRRWLGKNNVTRVVGVMESIYQSLAVPFLVPEDVEYVACIHDGEHHPGESHPLQRLGRKLELSRATRLVTFSDKSAALLRKKTPKQITVGSHPPFGYSAVTATPRKFPENRPLVFGLFGRLQEYKGIEPLLEAARLLRQSPAVPDFEIRIIGEGPAGKLRDTELGEQAEWDVRWIPEEEVDKLVRSFDVMTLPYTSASQSGPVTIALANAIPCVVTPVGALPDQAEGFGIVAENVSPAAIASAMKKMLTPEVYEQLSEKAAIKVNSVPSWKELADAIRRG